MSQPLTRWRSSSSKIATYSPYEQQVYKSLCKQAHEQYPVPSAKVNRKIIRTSIKTISSRTGINRVSVRRAIDTLHEGGFISYYKTKFHSLCMYISQPSRHRARPRFYCKEQVPPSRRPKELEKNRVGSVSLLLQEDLKKEKGEERRGDCPVPSTLPSEVNRAILTPSSSLHPYHSKKHPTYYADTAGLHCVLPGASRDACPVSWTFSEFEGLLGRLVQFGRETWNLPRLDRRVLSDKKHMARRLVLRYAMKSYQGRSGPPERRRAAVETELKNVILGNYQDHVERKKKGLLPGVYAELSDVFSSKNGAHMERKKWCAERGRNTVNENWQTRDRLREETKKWKERHEDHEKEVAKMTNAQQLANVRALLAKLRLT